MSEEKDGARRVPLVLKLLLFVVVVVLALLPFALGGHAANAIAFGFVVLILLVALLSVFIDIANLSRILRRPDKGPPS